MGSRPAKCTVEALETAGSADPRPGRDGVFSSEGTIQGLKPRRKNLLLSCHFKRFIPASRPSGPLGSPLPRPPRVANRPPRPLTRRPNPAYSVRVRTYMPLGTFGVVRRTRTPVQPLAEYVRILAYFHRVGRILEIPKKTRYSVFFLSHSFTSIAVVIATLAGFRDCILKERHCVCSSLPLPSP